ncbi:hypothetical protein NEMBOFW57_010099 [Staphylotrichum longicolle]|uniref:Uncharacterized protein n=1 Tax=Staphylotrichum longicolle TaxID=669026 RepID=A0AAD4EQG6_9PEZI|nr:hypothetical protein NEMBOFW57_010099 [Staphylotrichum longicolle]
MADIEGEVKYPAGFGMKDVVAWGSTGLVVHDEASQTVIKTPCWDDNELRLVREHGIRLEYVSNGNIRMFYHAHDQAEISFERRVR